MKKLIYMFVLAGMISLVSVNRSQAQAAVDKGNLLLNAGLGVGYYYAGGVPFIFSGEYCINDAISVGAYLGITSYKYRSDYKYTFIDFGARASYHFSKHLNLNTDQLDLYGGALLGYVSSSLKTDYPGYDDPYDGEVRFGVFGGARWYFTDKFAVNGEVGVGFVPLMLGVSFKL